MNLSPIDFGVDACETLRKCFRELRIQLIEAQFRGARNVFLYEETESEFLKAGGTKEEVGQLKDCLDKTVPLLKDFLSKHLDNGGFRESDSFITDIKVKFAAAGFTPEEFTKAIDMGIDNHFKPKQEAFAKTRRGG